MPCPGPTSATGSGDGEVEDTGRVSPRAGAGAPVTGAVHQLSEDIIGGNCSHRAPVCELAIRRHVLRDGRIF